jgi:hypothetical protein
MGKREDYIQQLVEYFRKNIRKGYTKESLKWALVNQGHSRLEVEKAMKRVDEKLGQEAPVLKTRPEIKMEVIEPKDAVIEKKKWWRRWFGK